MRQVQPFPVGVSPGGEARDVRKDPRLFHGICAGQILPLKLLSLTLSRPRCRQTR